MNCNYDTYGNYTCNNKSISKVIEGFAQKKIAKKNNDLIQENNDLIQENNDLIKELKNDTSILTSWTNDIRALTSSSNDIRALTSSTNDIKALIQENNDLIKQLKNDTSTLPPPNMSITGQFTKSLDPVKLRLILNNRYSNIQYNNPDKTEIIIKSANTYYLSAKIMLQTKLPIKARYRLLKGNINTDQKVEVYSTTDGFNYGKINTLQMDINEKLELRVDDILWFEVVILNDPTIILTDQNITVTGKFQINLQPSNNIIV
jgi:hypothetical protein